MPQGIILSEHAFKRLTETVKRSERAYRNVRAHRRRSHGRAAAAVAKFKRVRFYLPQALNGQLSVSNCPVITDWFSNAGTSSVTVYNEDGWTGDAGSEGLADYCPATDRWVIILLPCAAGTS